jgi:predicted nucleic acid-binding protein
MNVLVDTNVWCDFFNQGESTLAELLSENRVMMHPVVLGELAVGNLPEREQTLQDLQSLPKAVVAGVSDVLFLIEERELWGKGVQWNDILVLASAMLTPGLTLWTQDKRLQTVAREVGISFDPGTNC